MCTFKGYKHSAAELFGADVNIHRKYQEIPHDMFSTLTFEGVKSELFLVREKSQVPFKFKDSVNELLEGYSQLCPVIIYRKGESSQLILYGTEQIIAACISGIKVRALILTDLRKNNICSVFSGIFT